MELAKIDRAQPVPIGPYVKGQIVDYVQRHAPRLREMIALRRWHIVQATPQQVNRVAQDIESEGMAAYVPKEPRKIAVVRGRLHRTVMRPMYPGYIFAGFDPDSDAWHAIAGIEHVKRLFMINFRPVPLSEAVMERIRQIEAEHAIGPSRRMPIPFKVKDLVRVKDGPFASFFGFIIEIDDKERWLKVEVDLFGRLVPVQLGPEQVEMA